ncbi:hypothetical protein [Streptomyces coffeae]|uniref:Uncharacterized protein n=1 Tax=Streptomyces coffeae TaxID=621382 RepID=A0ABS1NC42_9ACTN|nr:hypothetical protein [Streptomyces coffeae]MBL1097628.1 hypothetical protein [Streptomyces coffeae]
MSAPRPYLAFAETAAALAAPDVAEQCARYAAARGAGRDLPAWRATDAAPLALVHAARAATPGRPVVAGSAERPARIRDLAAAGAEAFTVGSAAVAGAFAPRLGTLRGRLGAIMADAAHPDGGA